jgi:hypothetical protein
VIARVLEEAGLSTIALSLIREQTVKIKPPRAVFVPFPFGISVGHRNDAAEQRAVLDLAFSTLAAESGPVLLDFEAPERNERAAPLQASNVELEAGVEQIDFATELNAALAAWRAHRAATGRTLAGVSGISPERFAELGAFLAAFAGDTTLEFSGRPAGPLPLFVRACVDDLRAVYIEGRMQTHPAEAGDDAQRWLLAGTAFGALLRRLRDALDAVDDPLMKAAAFGIAR